MATGIVLVRGANFKKLACYQYVYIEIVLKIRP